MSDKMTVEQALGVFQARLDACTEPDCIFCRNERPALTTLRAELADMREELDATIEQRDLLSQEVLRLEGELDGLRRDAVLVAVYDAVSRANLTRDLKSPERKAQIVRTAMQENSHEP